MKEKELRKLIEKKESQSLEFKESLALKQELGETVSAFSNTNNGNILVGVKDPGKITGTEIGKKTLEGLANYLKQNTDNQVYPKITVETIDRKKVILINVREASEKPVFFRGKAYKRIGRSNHKLSASEIRKLAKESGKKVYWDEQVCEWAGLKDIDEEKVKTFLKRRSDFSGVSVPTDITQTLETMRAVKKVNNKLVPTHLGLLFFGREPQRFVPSSEIKVARFKGTDMVEFIDEARIKTTHLEALDEVENFVKKNTRKAIKIVEFERYDIPEYPYEAVREAVVNALAHRDYGVTGATVRVLIFDDRIEIDNPGVPPFSIKEIEGKHFARNQFICRRFHDVGEMEEYGTGISKMRNLMKKHNLKEPVFEKSVGFFKVTFYGPKEKILELVPSVPEKRRVDLKELGLNERQIEALRLMVNEGTEFTNSTYRKRFKVGNATAKRDLTKMTEKGLIEQLGRGRAVRYKAK